MEPQVTSGTTKEVARPKPSSEPSISTGHEALDGMLAGRLPVGHAVLIVSQSYDERDLLIRKMIEASLTAGRPTFFLLQNDTARTRDLTTRFGQNFYAMNPYADRIGSDRGNLFKVPDVGDLSGLSITSHGIIESKVKNEPGKLIVIDLLSDLLLRNKALTTRKWLSDFVSKRKAGGFTVLATLDPSIAPKEDVQTIIGVFDGVIEIYERSLQERARRFLVVKKMYRPGLLRERTHVGQTATPLNQNRFQKCPICNGAGKQFRYLQILDLQVEVPRRTQQECAPLDLQEGCTLTLFVTNTQNRPIAMLRQFPLRKGVPIDSTSTG